MIPRIAFLLFIGALVTVSSLACAARSDRPGADVATGVTARAEAYWKRREAKDLLGAYAFYCSAYKKRVSQAQFLGLTRLSRFDLRDTRVQAGAETGNRVEVTVSLRFVMPKVALEPLETRSTEWWARDTDGQWCKEDEPLVLPFPRNPQPASPR